MSSRVLYLSCVFFFSFWREYMPKYWVSSRNIKMVTLNMADGPKYVGVFNN